MKYNKSSSFTHFFFFKILKQHGIDSVAKIISLAFHATLSQLYRGNKAQQSHTNPFYRNQNPRDDFLALMQFGCN
jgi:hypothetical protein